MPCVSITYTYIYRGRDRNRQTIMEVEKVDDLLALIKPLVENKTELSAHYVPDGTFLHLVVEGDSSYELTTWSGKAACDVVWGDEDFETIFIKALGLSERFVTDYFPQIGAYEIILVHRMCNNLVYGSRPMVFVQSSPDGFTLPEGGKVFENANVYPITIRPLVNIPIAEVMEALTENPDVYDLDLTESYQHCVRGVAVVDKGQRKMYIRESPAIKRMTHLRNNWRNKYAACLRRNQTEMNDFLKINPQMIKFINVVNTLCDASRLMADCRIAERVHDAIVADYHPLQNVLVTISLMAEARNPLEALRKCFHCDSYNKDSFGDLIDFIETVKTFEVEKFFIDIEKQIEYVSANPDTYQGGKDVIERKPTSSGIRRRRRASNVAASTSGASTKKSFNIATASN